MTLSSVDTITDSSVPRDNDLVAAIFFLIDSDNSHRMRNENKWNERLEGLDLHTTIHLACNGIAVLQSKRILVDERDYCPATLDVSFPPSLSPFSWQCASVT